MSALTLNRRSAFAGAAALALAPDAASACVYATEIELLSAQVANYERKLAAHRAAIDAAEALRGAAPGWMYLTGEAHTLGEQRYESLIAILKETPEDRRDLDLMRRAASHADIRRGPRAWADFKVAEAEKTLAAV